MMDTPRSRGEPASCCSTATGLHEETSPALAPLRRDLLSDPSSLFKVSAPPSRCVSSAGAGWDGAFFAEVTAAPAGEFHHVHDVVVIMRWLTPLCTRSLPDPGDWTTLAPAICLRFPGDAQHGEWRGCTELQLLFVTPERVEAVLGAPWERSALPRWREPSVELPLVADVFSAMALDIEERHPAGPLVGEALLTALLTHLDGRGAGPSSPGPRTLRRRLHLVLEYIEANLARPLRLAELAEVASIRTRRFTTIFVAETGWSPHRYVLHRRVARAKQLMRDPALSLREIALQVGFTDQAQFSKVFRQYAGEPPSAFRRR